MNSLPRIVLGISICALPLFVVADAPSYEQPQLEPLSVHPRATRFVVDQVRTNHLIRNQPLNDEAASEIFDKYLDALDRRKHFFLQSDIDNFEAYRYLVDDALKRGRLEHAFEMMNRLQLRRDERYAWILERLSQGIESFDLSTDSELPIQTDDLEWPRTREEADLRWEHNLIDSILRLKLDGQASEEIEEQLVKRFTNRRNRNRQYTSEEAFAVYINSFTRIYDPHTTYFSPRVAEDFHMEMRMSLEGIGALLGSEDEYVTVISLVKGGPADLDGELKENHRIAGVAQGTNGPMIDVVGRRVQDVVDLIRGPRGTIVRLQVLEPIATGGQSKIVDITRDKVKLEEATAKKKVFSIVNDGFERKYGVIELPKMYADLDGEQEGDQDYRSATKDVLKLINELQAENIDGLIIDLRNNGGGSLPEAHKLVGLFIDSGPTVLVRGLGRNRQTMKDQDGKMAYDGPLAVMVNRSSASASEIFAGAIQDYGRGIVVGTQTYGKGSVQVIQPLNHGQLKITQAKYYRVTGVGTQGNGVVPDIEFPTQVDTERVGEVTYENALSGDSIKAAEFDPIADLDPIVDVLTNKHMSRVDKDPLFSYYRKVEDRIEQNRSITHVSLNEEVRNTQRAENVEWRIETENDYLVAMGEEPVETVSELDEAMSELLKKNEEEVDGMIKETGRILSDYIATAPTIAYSPSSAQDTIKN